MDTLIRHTFMYYVYILQSVVRKKIYTGSTNNLKRRFAEHNAGKNISTKHFIPWRLIYYEAYLSEQLARLREKKLKYNGNAIRELKKRIGIFPAPLFNPEISLKNTRVSPPASSTRKRVSIKSGAGFSTLEMVIAMALMSLTLSAVVTVTFGNQSMLVGGETNNEGMNKAQALLEGAQALSRKDFKLVNPIATTTDGIYQKWIEVTPSVADLFVKEVASYVTWKNEYNVPQRIKLTALVTNFENVTGGETCSSVLSGNWANPTIANGNTSVASLVGDAAGTYLITDLDVYNNKLYVTNNTSSANKETLFIFDVANPTTPVLLNKFDNDASNGAGLNAVTVSEHTSDAKVYAYVANASSYIKGQLYIIDVTNPSAASFARLLKIATTTVTQGTSVQGVGNSIFYKNGYIYLGLTKPVSGPEFNIIDVHNPLNPVWVSGYTVGNDINAITVRGKYAYLATPNTQELKVLDISNPVSPTLVGGFDSSGTGNGKSMAVVGDKLYLGRTLGGSELTVLDNTTPATISLPTLGSYDPWNKSINGLAIRDYLAFLLSSDELEIANVSNPASMSHYASLTLPGASTSGGSALDCERNTMYAGTNTNGGLYIISAGL